MTKLGDYAPHASCTLTACLDPLHPGPCKGWKGNSEEAFHRATRQSKSGIRAYHTARDIKGAKAAHRQAIRSYVDGSGPINRSLRASRGAGSNDPKILAEIKAMDQAMAASKLAKPIVVQRAISPSAFGGKDTNVDLTGAEYTDHAFGSTGTDLNLILKHFHTTTSGKRPLIADITVPAGMGAIRVPPGKYGDQKEVLLDRGAHFRVVKDNGYLDTPKGRFRHVTLEVVPGRKPRAMQVDLGEKNQIHRSNLTASLADDCQFCMQTHKPGLCKGQKRGETEPGTQDATAQTPVQKAQTAVKGLTTAIAQAQAVAQANAKSNPKLAAMARRAMADYQKALAPHQQTLRQAAGANAKAQGVAKADAAQQDRMDATAKARAKAKQDNLKKQAAGILARRAEAARVAKMTPKQRAAYGRQKTAQANAKRAAAENRVLKEAGRS